MDHSEYSQESAPRVQREWYHKWARRGLSRVCGLCKVLTPAAHCFVRLESLRGGVACRRCLSTDKDRLLPQPAPVPLVLKSLTYMENRLISFVRVNEFLLDLPTNQVPGQWGRVYVTPLEEPDACFIMRDVALRDGTLYVVPVPGMEETPLPVRPRVLVAALQYLLNHHPRYWATSGIKDNVEEALRKLCDASKEENHPHIEAEGLEVDNFTQGGPQAAGANLVHLRQVRGHAQLQSEVDAVIFPHLFPTGVGGFPGLAVCKLADYCRGRLLGRDSRFQQDPQYVFWLLEIWFKHKVSSNTQIFVGPSSSLQLFRNHHQIRQAAYSSLRSVPGTQPYLYAKRSVGLNMMEQLGPPSWFMTLTCHALQPCMLLACVVASLLTEQWDEDKPKTEDEYMEEAALAVDGYLRGDERGEEVKWPRGHAVVPARTASQLMNAFPAVVARQFMHQMRSLLRYLGGEAIEDPDDAMGCAGELRGMHVLDPLMAQEKPMIPPFHVDDYVVRIEWQKRGYPHAHMMLWTRGLLHPTEEPEEPREHDFGDSDSETVLDGRAPRTVEDAYDRYVCTRTPRRWAEIYKDAEMSKLAELQVHHHSAYCGAYALGACRFGFPQLPVQRTRLKEEREKQMSRSKNMYMVRRRSDAGYMGLYNAAILRAWRGSMDLQAISNAHNAHKYIMGYSFKVDDDVTARRRVEDLILQFTRQNGGLNPQVRSG